MIPSTLGIALAYFAFNSFTIALEECLPSDSECNLETAHVSLLQTGLHIHNAENLSKHFARTPKEPPHIEHGGNTGPSRMSDVWHTGLREMQAHRYISFLLLPVVFVALIAMLFRSDHDLLDGVVEKHMTSHGDITHEEPSWYRKAFLYNFNRDFGLHNEQAFRATVVFILYALPFFLPQGTGTGVDHLVDVGLYSSFIGQQILFNYQPTLGGTISMSAQTTCGTFLAVLTIWLLFGFFPQGVAGDTGNGFVYIVGVSVLCGFVQCMLWLNFPVKVTVFALVRFSEYIMAFLNPTADVASQYSVGFAINLGGNAMTAFQATFVGAALAMLANLLPYPSLALVNAELHACICMGQIKRSWQTFLMFMQEPLKRQDVMSLMQRELFQTKSHIDQCNRELDIAWWECLGMSRRRKTREVLSELNQANWDMYVQILGAVQCCTADETFADKHEDFMKKLNSLGTVIEYAGESSYTAAKYARISGTPEEVKYIGYFDDSIQKMKESIATLTKEFRSAKASMRLPLVDDEMTEEHVFCRSVCEYGRITADLAHTLSLDIKGERTLCAKYNGPVLSDVFSLTKIGETDHVIAACRLSVTYALVFAIGYFGASGIFDRYNARIPCTMALLISPGRGLQLVKNMNRLQGVVLGTALGSLCHAFFGVCSAMSFFGNIAFLAFWIQVNLLGFLMNREFSYLCFVLALFGQNKIVQRCDVPDAIQFSLVYEVVAAIGVMTIVDLFTPVRTAAGLAADTVELAWSKLQSALQMFDVDSPRNDESIRRRASSGYSRSLVAVEQDFERKGDIRQLVVKALELAQAAENEPRFAKTAWRAQSYHQCISMMRLIQSSFFSVENITSAEARVMAVIMRMDSFQKIVAIINDEMSDLRQMLVVFRHEQAHHIPALGITKLKFTDTEEHAKAMHAFAKEVSRMRQELAPDPNKPLSLEFDPPANISQIVACFDSMRSAMANFHCQALLRG